MRNIYLFTTGDGTDGNETAVQAACATKADAEAVMAACVKANTAHAGNCQIEEWELAGSDAREPDPQPDDAEPLTLTWLRDVYDAEGDAELRSIPGGGRQLFVCNDRHVDVVIGPGTDPQLELGVWETRGDFRTLLALLAFQPDPPKKLDDHFVGGLYWDDVVGKTGSETHLVRLDGRTVYLEKHTGILLPDSVSPWKLRITRQDFGAVTELFNQRIETRSEFWTAMTAQGLNITNAREGT